MSTNDASVYFDDLTIQHLGIKVLQANDYYPFGLPFADNYFKEAYRHGYQGQYAERDEETGWNAFELRMYDPIIARWMRPDPYGQYHSPYLAMGNNPGLVDPTGGFVDCPDCLTEFLEGGGKLMDEIVITSSKFGASMEALGSLIKSTLGPIVGMDREFGVALFGSGSEQIFGASDFEAGMYVYELEVEQFNKVMEELFPFKGERKTGSVNNNTRTSESLNLQDRLENIDRSLELSGTYNVLKTDISALLDKLQSQAASVYSTASSKIFIQYVEKSEGLFTPDTIDLKTALKYKYPDSIKGAYKLPSWFKK